MTTMTFDKLAYIDRMKAAGFAEGQARALADGLDQALREEVATKSDIAALRSDVDLLRVELKAEVSGLRGEFKTDLAGLRGEIKTDLAGLRGEFKSDLAALRGEMKADKIDLLKWVVMLIVGQTAVFTALKLLGH